MDFNFSYDIYPHPPMFCNNTKSNGMNQNMYKYNNSGLEHENQLDPRPISTNIETNDKFNISKKGYYKHYNVDVESKLLLSKPSLPSCKPKNNMTMCLEECETLSPVNDSNFLIENPKIWNNNSKRKTWNNKKN